MQYPTCWFSWAEPVLPGAGGLPGRVAMVTWGLKASGIRVWPDDLRSSSCSFLFYSRTSVMLTSADSKSWCIDGGVQSLSVFVSESSLVCLNHNVILVLYQYLNIFIWRRCWKWGKGSCDHVTYDGRTHHFCFTAAALFNKSHHSLNFYRLCVLEAGHLTEKGSIWLVKDVKGRSCLRLFSDVCKH